MLKHAALLFSSSGVGALLSFLLTALIARTLRPEGLGAYGAVLAWVYPLMLLAEAGVGTWLLRGLGNTPDQHSALMGGALRVRLVWGGALLLLTWASAPLLFADEARRVGLLWSAPLLLILPFFSTYAAVLRACEAFGWIAVLNVGMLATQLALTAGYLAAGGGLAGVFALNMLTSLGQLSALWLLYRARFRPPARQSPVPLRVVLRGALPYAGAAVLAALQLRAGILALERFAPLLVVGQYVACQRVLEVVRLAAMAGYDVLFARLVKQDDAQARARLWRRGVLVVVGAGGALTVTLSVVAQPLLRAVFGADYVAAAGVLLLLAVGIVPSLLRGLCNVFAYAGGGAWRANAAFALWLLVFATCVLVVANGAPLRGEHVALASVLADGAALLLLLPAIRR